MLVWLGVRVTRKFRVGFFGFPKMLPEIWLEKEEPENSGTRKFGFGFGFTRITRISHTSHIKFLTLCIMTANLSI